MHLVCTLYTIVYDFVRFGVVVYPQFALLPDTEEFGPAVRWLRACLRIGAAELALLGSAVPNPICVFHPCPAGACPTRIDQCTVSAPRSECL